MNIEDVKKIAVVGSGAMGHGIAQIFASADFFVTLTDVSRDSLDNAVKKIRESLQFLADRGRISAGDVERITGSNLATTLNLQEAAAGAQIVIEAVPEILNLKKKIFTELSSIVSPDTILATNTSTMSITDIGNAVINPARFAGIHFFNPVPAMKLAEVIYGEKTSDETISLICSAAEKCGRIPVKVLKDRPGFIVNRINAPNQAFLSAILDEGKIQPAEIDCVMKKMGLKMAPFETADFVGLDVFTHTLKYYSETLSPDYRPGKYLLEKIAKNELGMKTGKGIYDWSSGKALIETGSGSCDITPLHFLSIQINEAVKVYKEGIASSVQDIDNAVKFGMNAFAGPFALAAGMQPAQITGALDFLLERYGLNIFKPEPEITDGSFKSFGK